MTNGASWRQRLNRWRVWTILFIIGSALAAFIIAFACNLYMIAIPHSGHDGGWNNPPLYPIAPTWDAETQSTRSLHSMVFWSAAALLITAPIARVRSKGFGTLAQAPARWRSLAKHARRDWMIHLGAVLGLAVTLCILPARLVLASLLAAGAALLLLACSGTPALPSLALDRLAKRTPTGPTRASRFMRGLLIGSAAALLLVALMNHPWGRRVLGLAAMALAVLIVLAARRRTGGQLAALVWSAGLLLTVDASADDGTFREENVTLDAVRNWWAEDGSERTRDMAIEPAVAAGAGAAAGTVVGETDDESVFSDRPAEAALPWAESRPTRPDAEPLPVTGADATTDEGRPPARLDETDTTGAPPPEVPNTGDAPSPERSIPRFEDRPLGENPPETPRHDGDPSNRP